MQPISFCINTSKNERDYITLLLESLINGIDVATHEVLVFVDSDNQGTAEWLTTLRQTQFSDLTIVKNVGAPVGYAGNINWMFKRAKHDIVSYIQSDMIVNLRYDEKLLPHVTDNRILCSTRVEPPLHCLNDNAITFVEDFGVTPSTFKYEEFLRFSEARRNEKHLTDYFFAPFTLHKHLWNNIGGHDVRFLKSREDSDIALRLALKGHELKQTWDAMVYHFTCTSSRGLEWWKPENQERDRIRQENDMKELTRFKEKWGEFLHVSRPQDAERLKQRFLTTNPAKLQENIYATNPPIDETKLTIL